MAWWGWVAVGAVVLAVVIVAIVAFGTARHLPPLREAVAAMKQPQMRDLRARVAALQLGIVDLREHAAPGAERPASPDLSARG